MDNWYNLTIERLDMTLRHFLIVPEYLLPGQQIGCGLANVRDINLSLITVVWFEYRSRLESEIARFEKQIAEWVLQPTPKEKQTMEGKYE